MARTPVSAPAQDAPAYEPTAHYAVEFRRVVDLGDMKLRPAHRYPYVDGATLNACPPDAIKSATRVDLPA